MDNIRLPLPGEVWRINAIEAHCLFEAMTRLAPSYEGDRTFELWIATLKVEVQKYDLRNVVDVTTRTEITPNDMDRTFFELLVKTEILGLTASSQKFINDELDDGEEIEELQALLMECGHDVEEHINVLREWLYREIEAPKEFAASRAAMANLGIFAKLLGPSRLARADVEKIISQEIDRLRINLGVMDMDTIEAVRSRPELGYDLGELSATLKRIQENTLKDAENQLRAILEKRIIKE